MSCSGGWLELRGCTISNSTAKAGHFGVLMVLPGSNVLIADCVISDVRSHLFAGTFGMWGGTLLMIGTAVSRSTSVAGVRPIPRPIPVCRSPSLVI